ncbi:hypothetical protein TrLO_g13430, partial [Triparma laevis f. longispina]
EEEGGGGGGGKGGKRLSVKNPRQLARKIKSKFKRKREKGGEETLMESQIAVQRLRIGEINVFVSYKGEGIIGLEDFHDMHITLHQIVYSNKRGTLLNILLKLRKQIVLDLLSQVSRNFENIGLLLFKKFKIKGPVGIAGCVKVRQGEDGKILLEEEEGGFGGGGG